MPMHAVWDNENKTIIRAIGEGQWTWEEYHKALRQIVEMIKSVDHRVDLIYMGEPGSKMPPGSSLPHYQRAMRLMPENAGMHVIVTDGPFARVIIRIFLKMYSDLGSKFQLAPSIEAAYAEIEKERAAVGAV